ncbi:MAG: CopG family transcriptional regulator [Bacillales bacterium]|nr:CopG family transcriptional regulator [Bacillales bacterium]
MEQEKKKIGRPTNAPKTIVKRARMSQEDVQKLQDCCTVLGISESDVLRLGIDKVYQEIKTKERF